MRFLSLLFSFFLFGVIDTTLKWNGFQPGGLPTILIMLMCYALSDSLFGLLGKRKAKKESGKPDSIPDTAEPETLVPNTVPDQPTTPIAGKAIPKKKFFNTRRVMTVVISLCLVLVGVVIGAFLFRNTPQETPSAVQLARPANGMIYHREESDKMGTLCVVADYPVFQGDCYFVITTQNKREVISIFYVRAGKSISVQIPAGSYEVYYASGSIWYGTGALFGSDTVYHRCIQKIGVPSDSLVTLSLLSINGGNIETETITAKSFPH